MKKHIVATVSEIPQGKCKVVQIEGEEISLFNVNGKFVAYENSCSHQGAPICMGKVDKTKSSSEPESILWGRNNKIVRCPWHGWEYHLDSGESLIDPSIRLKSYPLQIDGDKIVLML